MFTKLRSPWLIWGLGAGFFFAEYFARVAPSVMAPHLMATFHVDALALGSFSALFYYSYVSMQIPVGVLVDRYGPHRLLTFMALICTVGTLMFSFAHDFHIAELGRLLTGFGAAFAFVGSLKLASVWFPPTQFGLLAGITQALGMLGAAVGQAPMALAVTAIGWRNTLFVVAVIFLLLAIAIGFFVRDTPTYQQQSKGTKTVGPNLWTSLSTVLANPQSWINAAYAGLVYAPTAAFAELWGVSFLQRAYGFTLSQAAMAVGGIFIGWGIGGPLMGWLSDKIQRRRPIMMASALLGSIFITAAIYAPHLTVSQAFILLLAYGISNTGVAISYALSCEINPRSVAGTSMAFANMASVLIGAGFQPLIGLLLVLHWDKAMVQSIPIYSAANFRTALMLLPLCSLLGVIFAWWVQETYCRTLEDGTESADSVTVLAH
ncbi:MFS transporter [soil metagenome]